MPDVWVYAASRESANEICAALAELGFGPHYLGSGEPVVPPARDGTTLGRPSLAVVVCGPDERADADLLARLGDARELDDVGLLLAVDARPARLAARPRPPPTSCSSRRSRSPSSTPASPVRRASRPPPTEAWSSAPGRSS